MATRLYGVATAAAPVSPAFDSWSSLTGAVRRTLSTSKAAATETRAGVAVTSGAGNETLGFQLVSGPLDGAQTITGTVTIMARGRELATSDNINARVRSIRVFSKDGSTLRGTLLTLGNHTVTTEPGTSVAGYQFANATSLSSVSAQDGDRVVVELGWGMTTTGSSPQYDLVIGGSGTDHTNTAGPDTTGTVPWIEFSQNLVFQPPRQSILPLGTGTRAFPDAVTPYNPGTLVVRVSAENGSIVNNLTPSGGGLTWSKREEANLNDINQVFVQIWTADTTSTTPVTVTLTPSGGGTPSGATYSAVLDADTGTGIGVGDAGTGKTRTINPATGSHAYAVVGDWSAGSIGTVAWTPSGATPDYAEQNTIAVTVWFGHWDSTTAGSAAYGLSTPSPTTPSTGVLEITQPASGPSASAATQDSASTSSARPGAKGAARTAAEAIAPSDASPGRKGGVRTLADSVSPTDQPAGRKSLARTTVDSVSPVGRPAKPAGQALSASTEDSVAATGSLAGARAASRAVADLASPADVPAGRRSANAVTADSALPADQPLGRKARSVVASDVVAPTDRPLGTRSASRATADSAAPTEVSPGRKARSASVADATSLSDVASKGLAASHNLFDSAGVAEALPGSKSARGATGEAVSPAARPTAGSATRANATAETLAPVGRPVGRKSPVGVAVDSTSPIGRILAKRAAAGSSRAATAVSDGVTGRKLSTGATRSSASPTDVIVRTLVNRNVILKDGELAPMGIGGTLRRYVSGYTGTPIIPGVIKPSIGGRLRRHGNP